MSSARRRLPFGAELVGANLTRFRLWAPDARGVELVRGESVLAMDAGSDGWHECTTEAAAGTRYRYRIDGGLEVPDPASRAQDQGIDGASIVVDPAAYAWQQPDWPGRAWEEAVIYELHAGLYGGFDGIRAELDDLAALGVTAIELMPVAQFSGDRSWGYDGALQFAPAAAYGTPDQLKALVDAAHARGLMVLLDVVYNHFGPEGNYLGHYASAFFDHERPTPWGAAIDFGRAPVREFFIENALYWLHEFRFDGLRIDAVHAITDDGFVRELIDRVGRCADGVCRTHVILEHEGNDATLLSVPCVAQWNDDAHHILHTLLTGEREGYYADYADLGSAALARWLGEGFIWQGEPMGWLDGRPRGTASAHLPPSAFVNCLQNHDQVGNRAFGDRIGASTHPDALRAAYVLLLLIPQIPMLFMGEERGTDAPFLYFTDFKGDLAAAVSKGRREDYAKFAAFAHKDVPDPNAASTFDASDPRRGGQDDALREHIANLLQLRRIHIVPRIAGATSLGAIALGDAGADAQWRMGDGRVLRVAINLSSEDVAIEACALPALYPGTSAAATVLPGRACFAWLESA